MLAAPQRPEAPARAALKVLIADDNAVLRAALRGLVAIAGHEVDAVEDGWEALEAAEGGDYDVIILDVQMPGLGGLEVAARLREGRRRRGVRRRVVGVSGETERRRALASGMDEFLDKPIRLDDLLRVLAPFQQAEDDRWLNEG